MPKKQQSKSSKKKENENKNSSNINARFYIIIAVAIILIASIVIMFKMSPASAASDFATFKGNFLSSSRVAIFATAYNGTVLTSTVGCATKIIESVVGSKTAHRNASTIDFYVVNATSCTYAKNGLGATNGANYTTSSLSYCLNMSKNEPTIFLNYSSTNVTTIQPKFLYTSGNAMFLSECGVASELTS